jgi:hypothetical protein
MHALTGQRAGDALANTAVAAQHQGAFACYT